MKGFRWSPPRQGRQRIADRWLDRSYDRVHCTGRPTRHREGKERRERVRQAKKGGCVFVETERRVGAPGVSPRGAERGSHLIRHRTRTKSGGGGVACSEEQTATPRSSGLRSKEKFQPKEMCFFLTSTFIEGTDALARKIRDFINTKGLAMVQIRCLRGFETKSEAFA